MILYFRMVVLIKHQSRNLYTRLQATLSNFIPIVAVTQTSPQDCKHVHIQSHHIYVAQVIYTSNDQRQSRH